MHASPNLAAQTRLCPWCNGRLILGSKKEGLSAHFSCKNRAASARAYDLVAETFETCANRGTVLRVTHNRPMLSAAADVISKTNQAQSPGKPRKRDPIPWRYRRKKVRKKRELRRSSCCAHGGSLRQVGLVFTVAHEP